MPERTEKIEVLLVLEKQEYLKHKKAVDHLLKGKVKNVSTDDLINIRYSMTACYHNVVKSLEAIIELCEDERVIRSADCEILKREGILFQQAMNKLGKLL